jgi:spore coat polysaccharide biosynthesis protein SpsF
MQKRYTEVSTREIIEFWAGAFGDEYTERNSGSRFLEIAQKQMVWATRAIDKPPPTNILEVGANRGLNLQALSELFPQAALTAVEINSQACQLLRSMPIEVFEMPIQRFEPKLEGYDLVLSSGVLMHQLPDDLPSIYKMLGRASSQYVLFNEYHDTEPREISYRGNDGRLWRRDFAHEFLLENPEFSLIDYGFSYKYDLSLGEEDVFFFLFCRK